MATFVFVLIGFVAVTATMRAADLCRLQWPALFGLAAHHAAAAERRAELGC